MPFERHRYPKEWEVISLWIRVERAKGRCECAGECGSHGHRCEAVNGLPHPQTGSKVVLTVAHLNHEPMDIREENLRAMCQRCHLAYDLELHLTTARARRRAARLLLQPEFDFDP